jgi:hypothetical protein
MSKHSTHRALNRLLSVIERSLPMYLSYARPWTALANDPAIGALSRIVAQQKEFAERIGQAVLEIGPIELGEYPIEFYDWHDLSMDFLIGKLVQHQKLAISRIERIVSELHHDRPAAALAEETLGQARGHLEILEELSGRVARPVA